MIASSSGIAVAAIALAFGIGGWLTHRLARAPLLLDHPNERSLHLSPVPRTGGIAILVAIMCALAAAMTVMSLPAQWAWIAIAAAPVALVSYLDDLSEIKPRYRLGTHLLAALLLLAGGVSWSTFELPGLAWAMPAVLVLALTLLYLVWMINLYNFMDGMDGFAGGMSVFGFGALAWLGWQAGDLEFALVNAVIAAASGGFLLHNFPPARVFMGDAGSATLGLLAAALSLVGAGRGLFPLWVAWLTFSPFIVDATWTLARRLAAGERVWQAHRSHHFQRLVLAGWSHRKTVLRSYLLMAACASTAVAAPGMSEHDQVLLLAAWTCLYGLIAYRIALAERGARPLSQ